MDKNVKVISTIDIKLWYLFDDSDSARRLLRPSMNTSRRLVWDSCQRKMTMKTSSISRETSPLGEFATFFKIWNVITLQTLISSFSCSSYVGRAGGNQTVSLEIDKCFSKVGLWSFVDMFNLCTGNHRPRVDALSRFLPRTLANG